MSFNIEQTKAATELFKKVAEVGMQPFSSLIHLCHFVLETQDIEGDIVEFGCYKGDTSKLLSFISNKNIFVYDSFQGLPMSEENLSGEMKIDLRTFIDNFQKDNIRLPKIYKGWFSDIEDHHLPKKISFAHLDGDLYISTLQPLQLIYNRLSPGAIILIDDFNDQQWWPGVKKAVDEFFSNKPEKVIELKGTNGNLSYKALIRKL